MYRKIFLMNKWDSVKLIQLCCERLDFHRLSHSRKLCFLSKLYFHVNPAVRYCASLSENSEEICSLYSLYGLSRGSSCSLVKIKIHASFEQLCLGN
jgi:hypothetical protein